MKVNYEVLDYLRSRKRKDLMLIERMFLRAKLNSIREDRMKLFDEFNNVERSTLVDLSDADKYEFEYRYNAYQRGLYGFYNEHGDGIGLDAFTDRVIRDSMETEKELKLRRG